MQWNSHKHKVMYLCFSAGTAVTRTNVFMCRHKYSCKYFSYGILISICLLFLLFFFTPSQVWVGSSSEVCSQHATGGYGPLGHCAHKQLDPGFGSASCSSGKDCSHKRIGTVWSYFFIFMVYFQSIIFGIYPLRFYPGQFIPKSACVLCSLLWWVYRFRK